ncbi:MAG: acetyltransferase, partial [Usitatibacteraceae bacterium]
DSIAIYILPNAAWARRVSGTFANSLASSHPHRAHAVLTGRSDEAYTVSIRAPLDHPHSADIVATHFPGGGGRAGAAGIDTLARDKLPALADLLKRTYVYAP